MHGRILESGFRPHPLLRSAHLQTILPSLLRPLPVLDWQLERIDTPDGDFVDLGWHGDAQSSRIAVLVHGLTGGFESKYLRGTARALAAHGWGCVALQLRGGGSEPNRTPRMYNHGDTADLRYLWRELQRRAPQARLATIGWSLGANVLLKALAEEGDDAPPETAVAVCAPFRLGLCAERLRTGFARVYQQRLLNDLKLIVRAKHARVPVPAEVDFAGTLAARDFFEFDEAYTAPLNGYENALDYYARAECGAHLAAIRRPTLVINAKDDPFMVHEVLPRPEQMAPCVTLELSQRGGHVGFVGRDEKGQPEFWLERRIAAHLEQVMSVMPG